MILLDVNLLVYAVHEQFDAHDIAAEWLNARFGGSERVALPWPVLVAFVRISADRRVFPRPLAPRDGMATVREWLALSSTWTPEPTHRHGEILERLLEPESRADLVPDAHLAALAIEHGLTLCSTDRDFARFEGLRWIDPLRAAA